ncbi:MAG: esterase-like activity of phytase family protein [Acidobacteria bacterium]|nr:esterase-like activity of phytase family protein [Acidobacteriota bacterium]
MAVTLGLSALGGALPASGLEPPVVAGLEWLGEAVIPAGTKVDGALVGGLSGLAWNAADGTFWALSDDRSELAPARAVRLRVDLSDGRLDPGDVQVVGQVVLADRDGRHFAPRSLDPEGIAIAGDRLYFSSEGDSNDGVLPFVAEARLDGRVRRYFDIPEAFVPAGEERGIRFNLGFESLVVSPDGRYLYTAVENALAQDGPKADVGVSTLARILRFPLAGGAPEERAYRVEGVRVTPREATAFRINGLNDIVPLGDGELLVLERQYADGIGNEARLYRARWESGDDVTGRARLDADTRPVDKELLVDFDALGIKVDNVEGMAIGPRLPDGRRLLLFVSDDNFNPVGQKTQLLGFAIDESPATIARVQGAGHRSPLEGRWVFDLEGVVTAVVDTRAQRGFWLESEHPDDDPATSEGLFVSWDGAPTLAVGERLRVHGRVVETAADPRQLTVTGLRAEAIVPLPGTGELPPPRRFGVDFEIPFAIEDDALETFDPGSDALDLWESLEGMRVELPGGDVIGPTLRYGEIVLLPEGSVGVRRTAAGGALLEPAGPPRTRVALSGRIHKISDLDVGARVAEPVRGVVHYDFSTYKVVLTEALATTSPERAPCDVETRLTQVSGRLTAATFNVYNLSAKASDERFDGLGRMIAERLGAPALVALEEIQDDSGPEDDGVVTSALTLSRLERAVAAHGGPRYEPVWIDPEPGREGGQPVGNIRVALLFDPMRLRLVRRGDAGALDAARIVTRGGAPELSLSPGRIDPTSAAFTLGAGEGVRRSLAVEFEVDGEPLFVAVNHWSSKWDDDRDFGANQPPNRPTEAKRLAQAGVVRAWVDELLTLDPEALVLVLGDFNEPQWAPGVSRLAEPPLENLVLRVPEQLRYSFNFDGASQLIDHVVVSPALAESAEIEIPHVDSDCAEVRRVSDHDPVVVRFRVR